MPFIFTSDYQDYINKTFSEKTYVLQGGTLNGIQPTFNGTPLFSGSYTESVGLVHFRINVLMTNITSFGTGQYYVTLPKNSKYDMYVRNGHLKHSSGDTYAISGNLLAGTNILKLTTTASNAKEVSFTHNVPVNLDTNCDFHIFGSYFSA